MATYDLTSLDISDLGDELLSHLLTVGEPLHVERKRDIPAAEQLSELLGSMANTEGGWALLGVEDDGTVRGLAEARVDLQDQVRDRVRPVLDPVPNFAAKRVTYQGTEIGVLRVYRSEDTPHVCTHKGAPYIRVPGAKRPAHSRRELDELIERGRQTSTDAKARLASSTVPTEALQAPELTGARTYDESLHREWIIRAAPLGLDPNFASRVRTVAVQEAAEKAALALLPRPGGLAGEEFTDMRGVNPGWITWGQRINDPAASAVVVDPAGVIATMSRERGKSRAIFNIELLVEQTIIPLLQQVLVPFAAAGTQGRFLCDLHARGLAGAMLQAEGQGAVNLDAKTLGSQPQALNGSAGVGELRVVASRLAADIAADAGLMIFAR